MRHLFAFLALAVCATVQAQEPQAPKPRKTVTPVMIGLVDPIQAPQSNWSVTGLRLNAIYGSCDKMTGLDIGAINYCQELHALQIGFINVAELMKGLQIGGVNYANMAVGVQIGFVNIIADKDVPFMPVINASF